MRSIAPNVYQVHMFGQCQGTQPVGHPFCVRYVIVSETLKALIMDEQTTRQLEHAYLTEQGIPMEENGVRFSLDHRWSLYWRSQRGIVWRWGSDDEIRAIQAKLRREKAQQQQGQDRPLAA